MGLYVLQLPGSMVGSTTLNLIISLFSGFVGGLVVMLIQNHLRNKKDKESKKEELRGLIRIVDAEMSRNEGLLREAQSVDLSAATGAGRAPILTLNGLEAADWDNTKVELARLLDGGHFASLGAYYEEVRDLSAHVQRLINVSNFPTQALREVQGMAEQCKAISDEIRRELSIVLRS